MNKKVLFLTNIISPYMNDFFETLHLYKDEIDFEVIACAKTEPDRNWDISFFDNTKYKYIIPKDIWMFRFFNKNRFMYLGGFSIFKKILCNEYDKVFFKGGTRFIGPLCAILCKIKGIKTILWEQNSHETTNTTLKKCVKKFYINKRFFDYFIAYGSHVKEFILNIHPQAASRLQVVFSAINNDKFTSRYLKLRSKRNLIRKKLDINQNEEMILFIGRLVQEKNIKTLIDTMKYLKVISELNIKCFIIGNGDQKDLLLKQIQDNNLGSIVKIINFQQFKKLSMFYCAADLFAIPSIFDPWPIVAAEAMNFALPIISSNKAGIKDILKEGQNGYFFEAENIEQMAEKITLAIKNKTQLGHNSAKIIEGVDLHQVCNCVIDSTLSVGDTLL